MIKSIMVYVLGMYIMIKREFCIILISYIYRIIINISLKVMHVFFRLSNCDYRLENNQ